MAKLWVWTAPKRVERDAGTIRFRGWKQYEPARVPGMWMRVAALAGELQNPPYGGWLPALEEYGPIDDVFDERPHEEETLRDPWRRTIMRLDEVSFLWRKEGAGIWELPDAPIELAKGYRRLQVEFARVLYDDVGLTAHGLEPVLDPKTLDAFLWLSAAESVRSRARFRKCERCDGWFAIRRTDAQYCSAVCRNWRPAPPSDEVVAAEE
jgi:hypothetical protein